MTSEPRPSAIEKALKQSSTASPTSDCATRKTAALSRSRGPRAAAGPGCARRPRRACDRECRYRCSRRRASRPRRRRNSGDARGSARDAPRARRAPPNSQHGASSNCQPAGRSQRASCTKGSAKSGARRSTRLVGLASGKMADDDALPLKAGRRARAGAGRRPPPPAARPAPSSSSSARRRCRPWRRS